MPASISECGADLSTSPNFWVTVIDPEDALAVAEELADAPYIQARVQSGEAMDSSPITVSL
jgi:hypothetical protein